MFVPNFDWTVKHEDCTIATITIIEADAAWTGEFNEQDKQGEYGNGELTLGRSMQPAAWCPSFNHL